MIQDMVLVDYTWVWCVTCSFFVPIILLWDNHVNILIIRMEMAIIQEFFHRNLIFDVFWDESSRLSILTSHQGFSFQFLKKSLTELSLSRYNSKELLMFKGCLGWSLDIATINNGILITTILQFMLCSKLFVNFILIGFAHECPNYTSPEKCRLPQL